MKKVRESLIGFFIAIAALYYTLLNVSLEELITSFKEADLVYILPGLVIICLSYVTRAYRWQVLLRPFKQIPVKEIYSPLMIGFMGSILPARAGEFIRAYVVGKKHNITFSGAFSTIIVERLFDLVCLMGLFVFFIAFFGYEGVVFGFVRDVGGTAGAGTPEPKQPNYTENLGSESQLGKNVDRRFFFELVRLPNYLMIMLIMLIMLMLLSLPTFYFNTISFFFYSLLFNTRLQQQQQHLSLIHI